VIFAISFGKERLDKFDNKERPAVNGFGVTIRKEYIREEWVFRSRG